ncbi:MAG: RraA family protein [Candidatus Dormibacteria bacterium]
MTADPEIIARYARLYSPLVSDCMDDIGVGTFSIPPGLQPFHRDPLRVVVGTAHTCQYEVTTVPEDLDVDLLLEVCDSATAGSVTITATTGDPSFAVWGGLMSTGTMARGGLGAVVDGPVRDLVQVFELGFPVWATSVTPRDVRKRGQVRSIDREVEFWGVRVRPGDLVMADGNGVAIVPQGHELAVLEACEERLERERLTQESLQGSGRPLKAIYAQYKAI